MVILIWEFLKDLFPLDIRQEFGLTWDKKIKQETNIGRGIFNTLYFPRRARRELMALEHSLPAHVGALVTNRHITCT